MTSDSRANVSSQVLKTDPNFCSIILSKNRGTIHTRERQCATGRRLMFGTKYSLALLSAALLISGCEGVQKKTLVEGYHLEHFEESGRFYVRRNGDLSSGGAFDGSVLELAWNNDFIVARVDRLYQGDRDGIYLLNLKDRLLSGPFTEQEIESNSLLAGLKLVSAPAVLRGSSSKRTRK